MRPHQLNSIHFHVDLNNGLADNFSKWWWKLAILCGQMQAQSPRLPSRSGQILGCPFWDDLKRSWNHRIHCEKMWLCCEVTNGTWNFAGNPRKKQISPFMTPLLFHFISQLWEICHFKHGPGPPPKKNWPKKNQDTRSRACHSSTERPQVTSTERPIDPLNARSQLRWVAGLVGGGLQGNMGSPNWRPVFLIPKKRGEICGKYPKFFPKNIPLLPRMFSTFYANPRNQKKVIPTICV